MRNTPRVKVAKRRCDIGCEDATHWFVLLDDTVINGFDKWYIAMLRATSLARSIDKYAALLEVPC